MAGVEILATWHPDEGGFLTVFVDGVRVEPAAIEWVDPGRGHERSSWQEHTETVMLTEGYSPAFRDAVVDARWDARESKYIEDDIGYDETVRDEGQEPLLPFRCGFWRGDITTLSDEEVYLEHTSSEEANAALGAFLIRRGFTDVHLEKWEADIDQGPLNRGWGLYGHLHAEEGK